MSNKDAWKLPGLCRNVGLLKRSGMVADDWFRYPRNKVTARAKQVCEFCPIQQRCQDEARTEGIDVGVWGGEDATERKAWWKLNGGRPTAFSDSIRTPQKIIKAA